ncbi:MAG: lipopolysaccharide transport periplasmic protein LptA [Casimicrobiaceae bacterium]
MRPPLLLRAASVALLGAALLSCVAARAEKADRVKPINYSADSGDVNIQTKVGTLVGNVVITQGTLTIHADKVVFRQNADNSLAATAYGNPVSFRQRRDGVNEYYEGFAQRGEYDGAKELLQLYDRALLRRSGDEIRSNYISYNTATELFKAEGRPGSGGGTDAEGSEGRVRGVFQPRNDLGAGKADPAKPAPAKPSAPVSLKPAGELAPGKGR